MKKVLIFLFLLLSMTYAENTLSIDNHVNFRAPKDKENSVDWFVGLTFDIKFHNLLKLNMKLDGSLERDNGENFYSHLEKIGFKYGYLQYLRDTEMDIDLFNLSGYWVVKDIFKIGCDLSWNESEPQHGAYLGLEYKWLFAEMTFWDKIHRIKAEITPKIELGKNKNLAILVKANILYAEDVFDWNFGYGLGFIYRFGD